MRPRPAVLLTPPKSSHPCSLLSCQRLAHLTPLAATLMDSSASVANKRLTTGLSPLAATLTKNAGWGPHPFRVSTFRSKLRRSSRAEIPTGSAFSTSSFHILASLHPCFLTSYFRFQLPHQIRNNYLPENHWIGPHLYLPPQVPALRINPRFFWNIPAAQKQIRVRNWHLRIQSAGNDQHWRHRFPQQPLRNQRHLWKNVRQVLDRFRAFKNRHQRRCEPEKIFAIPQRLVDYKIFLERRIRRRRLRHHRFQPRMFQNRQLGRPVRAETLAVHANTRLVHFRPCLQVIDDARKLAFRRLAGLDWRLPGTRRIQADKANSVRQDSAEVFGKIFLAAIEPADGNHQRHRPFRIFRQPQISDDLRTFKRNANDFERRVH